MPMTSGTRDNEHSVPHPVTDLAPSRPRFIHALVGLTACGAIAATYSLATLAGAANTHAHSTAPKTRSAPVAQSSKPQQGVAAAQPELKVDATASKPDGPPTAAEFAEQFFATANAYAAQHGHVRRLGRAHCVQASPGHYMCSYESRVPGKEARCHVVQARWTPDADSTFTVTLSGRAAHCGSLRAALRSLR
jgi:hypothetical protein